MPDSKTIWPDLNSSYFDEFGNISPDVYAAAGDLWPMAERFSLLTLRDVPAGMRLMLKAATRVSQRRSTYPGEIRDLKAYLFSTFKRQVFSELEREAGRRESAAILVKEASNDTDDVAKSLETKILIDQLVRRMDSQTRNVFQQLVLGYTFEEIAGRTHMKANVIRSMFQKRVKRLAQIIARDAKAAGIRGE